MTHSLKIADSSHSLSAIAELLDDITVIFDIIIISNITLHMLLLRCLSGLLSMLPVIGKVSSIITSLNLSRSGITGKAVRKLGETLNQNGGFLKSLQCVDVSENSLKGDDVNVRQTSVVYVHC